MKAAILTSPRPVSDRPLHITDVAEPQARTGHVLLRVRACGVCRTDLHIVEGELPPQQRGHNTRPSNRGRSRRRRDRRCFLWARASAFPGSVERMAPAPIANEVWRTCATRRRSLAIVSLADMRNTRWHARISFTPCPQRSTTCTLLRFCALASLASEACGWRVSKLASALGSLVSVRPRISRSQSCARGSATCTSLREGSRIVIWLHRWARPGSEAKRRSRPWNSIARSPSPLAVTS